MNAPDKCPRCGADSVMQSSGSYFRCGTWATSDGTVDQSRDCTSAQRDALAARVNAIQVELAFAEGALLQRLKRIERLEDRVKELEPYEATCKNPAALWTNWLRGTVALPAGIGDVRQEQARVKELEAKLAEVEADRDSWAEQADQRVADAVEAMKREEAWKGYAERLEEAGDEFIAGAEPSLVDNWNRVLETKP